MIDHVAGRFTRSAKCPRRLATLLASIAFTVLTTLSSQAATETVEGFTEPFRTIDVASSELGIVNRVAVKKGDHVEPGQLLAELRTDVLERTLAIAQARAEAVGAAQAAIAERNLKLKRLTQLRKLMNKGHATPGEIARAKADLSVAEARVQMAEEELRMAALECKRIEAQIENRRIRSPISGIVSEVHREIGEAFAVNQQHIVTLVQLDQLRVRFSLMPHQAVHIAQGQSFQLSMPDIGQTCQGVVERIAPVMDAKSGTITVDVLIDNRQRLIRSGTRCEIQLEAGIGPSEQTDSAPFSTRSVTELRRTN